MDNRFDDLLTLMMENRQFHSFIIITMILIATHDSPIRWEERTRCWSTETARLEDDPSNPYRKDHHRNDDVVLERLSNLSKDAMRDP